MKHQESYFFERTVREKQWFEAFKLLLQRRKNNLPDKELPASALASLARYFFDEANLSYQQGVNLRDSNFPEAEKKYRKCLVMLDTAVRVQDLAEYRSEREVHKRLLAQIMIDRDEMEQTVSLERVNEALSLLDSIDRGSSVAENQLLDAVWIRVLDYIVSFLHQKCLGTESGHEQEATDDHKKWVEEYHEPLMKRIDQLIDLTNKTIPKNTGKLASLHFLKAECLDYFKWEGNATLHYKQACALEPRQAYYHLRYAELIQGSPDEKTVRDKGVVLLEAIEKNSLDYLHWFDERWQKEEARIYNEDIPPAAGLEESGFSFQSVFGF